jgi:hypothetical protein
MSASGWGRGLAAALSVVVAGAMVYAQNTETPASPPEAPAASAPGDEVSASTPAHQHNAVANAAHVGDTPTEAELLAASAPMAAQDFKVALPRGVAPEEGLQVHTIWAARAISLMFMEIKTIGGFRQDPLPWHPNGLAIDVMIPNHQSPEGIELGNQIAGYVLANAERWGVLHVIWRQGFYPGIGAPSWTADYGNETANHYDHVHIATDGGGFPTGREKYYLSSMETAEPS